MRVGEPIGRKNIRLEVERLKKDCEQDLKRLPTDLSATNQGLAAAHAELRHMEKERAAPARACESRS